MQVVRRLSAAYGITLFISLSFSATTFFSNLFFSAITFFSNLFFFVISVLSSLLFCHYCFGIKNIKIFYSRFFVLFVLV